VNGVSFGSQDIRLNSTFISPIFIFSFFFFFQLCHLSGAGARLTFIFNRVNVLPNPFQFVRSPFRGAKAEEMGTDAR
jgi:hypothetical protein